MHKYLCNFGIHDAPASAQIFVQLTEKFLRNWTNNTGCMCANFYARPNALLGTHVRKFLCTPPEGGKFEALETFGKRETFAIPPVNIQPSITVNVTYYTNVKTYTKKTAHTKKIGPAPRKGPALSLYVRS